MWLFYNTNTFKRQLNKYKIPKRCKRPESQPRSSLPGNTQHTADRRRTEWGRERGRGTGWSWGSDCNRGRAGPGHGLGRHPSKRFIQAERFINSRCTLHAARCRLAAWNVLPDLAVACVSHSSYFWSRTSLGLRFLPPTPASLIVSWVFANILMAASCGQALQTNEAHSQAISLSPSLCLSRLLRSSQSLSWSSSVDWICR